MATSQKHVYVPEANTGNAEAQPVRNSGAGMPSPADLPQAYAELQQRFQRTTNALGSAAHDLKTPLSILNGYVELLQSEKLGPISERQREVLRDMQASGQRLQQFIQDFLTYSALETGGLKMQFTIGNLNDYPRFACCVRPVSRKRDWLFIFWPMTNFRNFLSTRRRSSAWFPIF
jgi:signal transduction histidine kinase